MGKYEEMIGLAERHRQRMEAACKSVNAKLAKLLDDDSASVFYQASDGWCVLFSDGENAPVFTVDLDALLKMGKAEALDYLYSRAI